jgi:hypothetical protein
MVRDDDGDDDDDDDDDEELLLMCWYNRHKANYRERGNIKKYIPQHTRNEITC